MKKFLFVSLVIINVTVTKAQFVNIPDANFRNWLNANGFASCMNGNMMDTTCTAVLNATQVVCSSSNISNLTGIQYFDNLNHLNCQGNQLTSLPRLPITVTQLWCGANQLTSLPTLPPSLGYLFCWSNQLTSLPDIPSSVYDLECYNNLLTHLPTLPSGLITLSCSNNQLTSLPDLFSTSLQTLSCSENSLTSIPSLPSTIQTFYCYDNQITSLPNLPSSLIEFYCMGNQLTSLPNLPGSVYLIYCHDNQLTSLPALPGTLHNLSCHNNQLTSLPNLPTSLKYISCDLNMITSLPLLPSSLQSLTCSDNSLTNLPGLPASLFILVCNNNQLSFIPDLPDSMANLNISNNPGLTCFPKYKKINNLTWSNTGITCLQNTGTIVTATPPVNALPICPPPAATITPAGALTFCSGGSVTLNANAGAGFTYKWIKNGSSISGATGQSYAAITSGSYAVEVTHNCGFATSTAVTVTVNSLPSATITPAGPTTFCSGGSVVLNAVVAANRTYQWKKGANLISGATLSSYTATTGGSYRVIVTNTLTGCSKTTGSATVVTINTLPTATVTPQGPTTFCAGGSVVLQANTGTGFTYKWKKGSNFISGATLANYTATTGGNYKVQVTNSNGCSKISGGVVVSVPCKLSESENESESAFDVKVYPNPNLGEFTITFSNQPTSPIQMELTDELGKVVKRFETSNETVVIKESNLAKGIYCLAARNNNEVVIKKINIVK